MPNVADLENGQPDRLGQTITRLYARKEPIYGVYEADQRVMICYADASQGGLNDQQRRSLSELAPIRGEIDGLIDGWKQGVDRSLWGVRQSQAVKDKAQRFNRGVADALIVALEGDLTRASAILNGIRQRILDERTARGRFEYLVAALLTSTLLMFGAWLISSTYPLQQLVPHTRAGPAMMLSEDPNAWSGRMSTTGLVLLLLALLATGWFFYARWVGLGAFKKANDSGDAGEKNAKDAIEHWPRFWSSFLPSLFLLVAIAVTLFALFLNKSLVHPWGQSYSQPYPDAVALWRAAAAGSVGAFFSIAIGIRTRTVLLDLLRTSNLMDAALRVTIGFIGAAVLMALLLIDAVKVSLGSADLIKTNLLGGLLVGFVAGFSERLVPDLLARATVDTVTPTPARVSTAPPPPPPGGPGGAGGAGAAGRGGGPDVPPPDPLPDEANEDGCASDHEVADDEVSRDDELPPSAGGVAPADEEQKV